MSLVCGHLIVSKQIVVNEDIHYSLILVGKNKIIVRPGFRKQ